MFRVRRKLLSESQHCGVIVLDIYKLRAYAADSTEI
jgi:hypothetical protein